LVSQPPTPGLEPLPVMGEAYALLGHRTIKLRQKARD
jgi:hypothetical protein